MMTDCLFQPRVLPERDGRARGDRVAALGAGHRHPHMRAAGGGTSSCSMQTAIRHGCARSRRRAAISQAWVRYAVQEAAEKRTAAKRGAA